MSKRIENGLYLIDAEYRILHYNAAVKEMYPEVETGRHCYEVFGCQSERCDSCPLRMDGERSTFYNDVRHELVDAQATEIDLPPFGHCYSIMFTRSKENADGLDGDAVREHMRRHIDTLRDNQTTLENALKREMSHRHEIRNLQREILDSISCGVIAYSLPGHKLITANDAARKMIGCAPEEDPVQALKTFLLERVLPEDRPRVMSASNALTKPGDLLLQDYRARVNGRIVHLHSNIKYLENADGQTYILVTMLDTTQQALLTQEVAKERKAYHDALANGSEFSFLLDVTEGMLHEAFITAHGVDLVRSLGFTVPVSYDALMARYVEVSGVEFADEAMRRNFTCKGLLDAFAGGVTNVITEYHDLSMDLFLRVSCLMSLDEDTGHVKAAVVADDVTEIRKKDRLQQEKLKAAYDEMDVRMSTILSGLSGGFKIADADDGYRYVYISEGAAQLQGYTQAEFMERFGWRVTSNINEENGEPALDEALEQIEEKGHYEVKYRVPHKDGSTKWVIDRGKMIEDPVTGKRYLYILMQDITDLEERNIQIRNMLSMQEHMSESVGNGIFAYTLPGHELLILNKEARRMFASIGSDEQAHGRDINSLIYPEDKAAVREAVSHLVSPGDSIEYVFHASDADGDTKTFKCTTKLLSFVTGQKYIISSLTDITEQKLTETRLAEERHRYREALTFGCSGTFVVDLTGGVMTETVMTREGMTLDDKLHVDLPVAYDDFAAEWLSDSRIVSASDQIAVIRSRERLIAACHDGTNIIDLEYNIPEENKFYRLMTLLHTNNDRVYATFIIYDITGERSNAQKRRAVIDSLGEMYTALYHFSFADGVCTMLKAKKDVLDHYSDQCDLATFCAQYPERYVEDEYRQAVAEFLDPANFRSALASAASISIDFKRKGLGWCRINLVAAERDCRGEVTVVVFAGAVIDKQKQRDLAQQEALRTAYEAANIANEAKTNFLANMSHDIRTPMNAIIGMTAIAGTHMDDKERVADCLAKISVSSKHLLGIINDVLDMSKIESGKMNLQEDEFKITELIENLVTMSRPAIDEKGHRLSVFVRNIDHENVVGDSQRLQQVFMNLMSNAVKYTPEGGAIKLTITEKPTGQPQFGCYEFVLEDNGIGMSEEFQTHLFEPFARATDDARIEKIQGTGLGMAITKNIIQQMNGAIKVKSQLNVGSTFTVTFFLNVRTDEEAVDFGRFIDLPVLVADDDADSCAYACNLLGELGMSGEWVLSGEEAVERVVRRHQAGQDYFAVILDWRMPGKDGVETTREIRSRIGKNIPIIIISGYDWSDIELEARAAGANAFISKPMFRSRVVHVFNDLLGVESQPQETSALGKLVSSGFDGKRALLVEDNELNAEIAGEILGMAGIEVQRAVNGKEAVDIMSKVQAGYFDVVFMDIQMPIMNGYEATRAIRALPGDYVKSVPIFAMTANAFVEDVAAAKNAGMNEHIAKPMDFDQITKTLKKWLG